MERSDFAPAALGMPDLTDPMLNYDPPRLSSSITDLFNGFSRVNGDSFTGGPSAVRDNTGALITPPLNLMGIEGGRFVNNAWTPYAADGAPIAASQMVRTRRGLVQKYASTFKGFLNEPARTNFWLFSEPRVADITVQGTVTEVAVADRGLSRWLRVERGGIDTYVNRSIAMTVGDYIFSVFVKMDDGGEPFVGTSGAGAGVDFSLLIEGNSTSGTAPLAGKQNLGGGMWRLWAHRAIAADVTSSIQVRKYTTHSARSFTVTGMVLEKGTFPTSYIATTSATVTRAATVYTRPTAGVLRANDWGVWLKIMPYAGQDAAIAFAPFGAYTDSDNLVRLVNYADRLRLTKKVAGAVYEISTTQATAGQVVEIQAFQSSVYGMGIRVRFSEGAWSAWAVKNDAGGLLGFTVPSGYQIGGHVGATSFAGYYPFTAIIQHSDPKAELERLAARYP